MDVTLTALSCRGSGGSASSSWDLLKLATWATAAGSPCPGPTWPRAYLMGRNQFLAISEFFHIIPYYDPPWLGSRRDSMGCVLRRSELQYRNTISYCSCHESTPLTLVSVGLHPTPYIYPRYTPGPGSWALDPGGCKGSGGGAAPRAKARDLP